MHDLVNRAHQVDKCFAVCTLQDHTVQGGIPERFCHPPSHSRSSLCQFSHAVQRFRAARPFVRLAADVLRRTALIWAQAQADSAPTARGARKAMLIDERSIPSLSLSLALLMASSLALEGAWMVARLAPASCEYRLDFRG